MLLSLGFFLLFTFIVKSLDNGLALTPQMGWNSWNRYGCSINQDLIETVIHAMINQGLREVGYKYVNLDDCWQSAREPNGTIIPDPTAFPDGIVPLVNLAHHHDLKLGLYSDAGNYTCQHRPGSLGYETIDANTYAAWGVDYLKYDNCNNDNISPLERYPVMRDALNATGRPIFYSLCEWGIDDPWTWGMSVGNSWRTTGDISDNWDSMLKNWDNNGPANDSGPGGWNDPDMLEVGNGGMTTTEYIAHFSLWAMGKAPLIIGCDIINMTDVTKMILKNTEVIAINQDPLGKQCTLKHTADFTVQIYGAHLVNDEYAVLYLNRGYLKKNVTVTWRQLELREENEYVVRDLWLHKNLSTNATKEWTAEVHPHAVVLLRLYPVRK